MIRNKRQMKVFAVISLFMLLLTISPWALSDEYSPRTIAVVNFENTSNLSEFDYLKKTISEYINTYLLTTGRIKIVEREQLEKSSLRELNLSLTDIVDATTAAKLGKIEGAEAVVIGSFSKIGSTVVINARLIDVETSEGITAVQEKGKEDELVGLLDRVSEALKKVILQDIEAPEEEKEALSTLFIQSNPPGASIYLNGEAYGLTPKDIYNLREGTYEIVLSKEGYETYIKKINLSLGEEVLLKISLFPQKGILSITSSPSEAEVYLDEEYKGKTPLSLSSVSPGEHKIKLTKEGRATHYETVVFKVEENTTVDVVLSANNPPRITSLTAKPEIIKTKETSTIISRATDPDKDTFSYTWSTTKGTIQGEGETIIYRAPSEPGTYSIEVTVSDGNGAVDTEELVVMVITDKDLFPVVQNDKWGYIDKTGRVVFEPQFDWAGSFSEGLASVGIEYKRGYIDKTGRVVIEPQFDWAGSFSEGLARVEINDKEGYINRSGRVVIGLQFDFAGAFSEGLARVREDNDDKWGYIDKTGKYVWRRTN